MECFRHHCPCPEGSVVTIGNFDGMHRGHQAILEKTISESKNLNVPSVLICFEPTPQQYFQVPNFRKLMSFRAKAQALSALGLDKLWVLGFNRKIANLSAEAFISQILCAELRVAHLVIGHDFRFGRERRGNEALLKAQPFEVTQVPPVLEGDEPVSSSRIRQALLAGDLAEAALLQGRPYALTGRVGVGERRGTPLGFPTANIRFKVPPPAEGVYAVELEAEGTKRLAVANIGTRPTFNGTGCQLEVHVLDWSGNLYGKMVTATLRHKIRSEKRFDSIEALKQQITQDVQDAREFFLRAHL